MSSRVRGGYKSRATILLNELTQAIAIESTTLAWIQTQIEEIERQRIKIQELDDTIVDNIEDDLALQAEIEAASKFSMRMTAGIRAAHDFIATKQLVNESTKSVKLPNITLKKFNGNPLDWPAFWDLFKTSIGQRQDIGDPAKFYYLVSQLEGDAAMLLQDFDHTAESYSEAVELLQKNLR